MENEETGYNNVLEVAKFLQDQGWKVRKSSIYRHIQEGKLRPEKDGTFNNQTVLKYARTFLKRFDGTSPRQGYSQRLKGEAETRKLTAQARVWERKAEILEKKYISRDQIEIELAGRAAILDAGLHHWIHTSAMEWIRAVSGDEKLEREFIQLLSHDLDEHINEYAKEIDYRIIIDYEDASPENVSEP